MSWRWIVLGALLGTGCGDGDDGTAITMPSAATSSTTAPSTTAVATTAVPEPIGVVPDGFATAGADGMAFVYDVPTEGNFWMRDTPTPLSIAFFAADGSFVSATDMVPCLEGAAADCPRYGAAAPYATAIEVFAGDLAALGIAAGSRLDLLGTPCDPRTSD